MSVPWPNRGSIRFRITALAAVLAGIVLACAAVALVALQREQLTANLDSSLEQRADNFETTLGLEDDSTTLSSSNDEDRAVQLVDSSGQVLLATPNLTDQPPLRARLDPSSTQVIDNQTVPQLEDDAYRVLTRRIDTAWGPAELHVAQNIDDLNDTFRGLTIALLIAVPAVVTILAALTWWLVGRTLRPVELIRAEVADISGADLDRRVPVSDQGDEIARLATTMNEMLDRLDNASRRQRQFVADASHELRTPLTRIRTEVEVDLNQPDRADPAATNATVLEESIGLQLLLDDLLFLARTDERQFAQRTRPVDLDDVVFKEVVNFRGTSPIDIDTTNVEAVHLTGDPEQLGRVVRNLLSNAVRHAETNVSISVQANGASTQLVVVDDGPGVPPDARSRIFQRFGRADDARTRSDGGAGLGLAIARDIVTRHGGSIRYDDAWVDGARFIVTLPSER